MYGTQTELRTETRIDLPDSACEAAIELLQPRLADAVDLATQAKQAHWNVKGPGFMALHQLFDRVAEVVRGHADAIAERVTALGGMARGTARVAAAHSSLEEYPLEIREGRAHVAALAQALAAFGGAVRGSIGPATEAGDLATADLLTEVSRSVDQHLWFVEAHVQAES